MARTIMYSPGTDGGISSAALLSFVLFCIAIAVLGVLWAAPDTPVIPNTGVEHAATTS